MRKPPKKRKIDLHLTLPTGVLVVLMQTAEAGLLGTTVDEVVEHILREHLWQKLVRETAVELAREAAVATDDKGV